MLHTVPVFTIIPSLLVASLDITLENHCTRTAQSSRGGCSRRVHKIEYLAVNKSNHFFGITLGL